MFEIKEANMKKYENNIEIWKNMKKYENNIEIWKNMKYYYSTNVFEKR